MPYDKLEEPKNGKKIQLTGGKIQVPDNPIIPFIEGDGIGRDITKATQRVVNAAVEKSYGGKKKIEWIDRRSKKCKMNSNPRIQEVGKSYEQRCLAIIKRECCYEKLNRIPEFRTYFANQILFVYYVYHSKSL